MNDSRSVGEGIPPDLSISSNLGLAVTSSVHLLSNQEVGNEQEGMQVDFSTGNYPENAVSVFQSQFTGDSVTQNVSNDVSTRNDITNPPEKVNISTSATENSTNTHHVDNSGTKTSRPVFKYSQTDIGPFVIYIENVSTETKGSLNAIKVGGIILSSFPQVENKIKSITSIGKNRIKVILSERDQANCIIESPDLRKHNLTAYIPSFIVYKRGVIRNVCKEYPEDVLKNIIRPFDTNLKFTVDEVKRIKRKLSKEEKKEREANKTSADGQNTSDLVSTQSIIVSFRAHALPKYVVINRVRCEVEPYVQKVLLCYNCFRYGHIGKQCKSSVRCLLCGEGHSREACTQFIPLNKCLNCQGNHLATQLKACPEFQRQKNIKKAMSQSNLSYNEAAKTIPRVSYSEVVQRRQSDLVSGSQPQNISLVNVDNTIAGAFELPSSLPQVNRVISENRFVSQQPAPRPNKRMREVAPNPTMVLHNQIIAPASLQTANGNVLRHSSNPNFTDREFDLNRKSLANTILELITVILDTLKEKNSFDIQQIDLAGIMRNKLGNLNIDLNG